jgi:hypothetical protein
MIRSFIKKILSLERVFFIQNMKVLVAFYVELALLTLSNHGCHLGSEQFDRMHNLPMRHGAYADV